MPFRLPTFPKKGNKYLANKEIINISYLNFNDEKSELKAAPEEDFLVTEGA